MTQNLSNAQLPKKRDWRQAKRRRCCSITVRLTPEERAQIVDDANRAGTTPGAYIRQEMLAAPIPKQAHRLPANDRRPDMGKVLSHLGKIGSNLNQLARQANTAALTGDWLTAPERQQILDEWTTLNALLLEIRTLLKQAAR